MPHFQASMTSLLNRNTECTSTVCRSTCCATSLYPPVESQHLSSPLRPHHTEFLHSSSIVCIFAPVVHSCRRPWYSRPYHVSTSISFVTLAGAKENISFCNHSHFPVHVDCSFRASVSASIFVWRHASFSLLFRYPYTTSVRCTRLFFLA